MTGSVPPLLYRARVAEITPTDSLLLAGFANRKGASRGIHRPLTSRALVLRQGERAVCLIANDLLELESSQIEGLRRAISTRTGIPSESILIHSIHTHSAPWMERGLLDANDRYIDFATERIVENACRAAGEREAFRSALVETGSATCDISARRELVVPESGKVVRKANLEKANDREARIVRIVDAGGASGKTVGGARENKGPRSIPAPPVALVNFACHPVVLGFNSVIVSPDYPGRGREVIEEAWDGTAFFLNGAAGNINPVEEGFDDPAAADRYGEAFGQSVIRASLAREPVNGSGFALDVVSRRVTLPYRDRPITKDFLAREAERKSAEVTEFVTWKQDLRRWAAKMGEELDAGKIGDGLVVELDALRIGPAVFLFTQGELFNSYQAELKRRFSGVPLGVVGYSNGEIGYIPDAEAFARPGYETDLAYVYTNQPSPLTPDAEGVFLDNATEMIGELTCRA